MLNRLDSLNPLNPNTSNNKEMKTVKEMIEKVITGIKNKFGLNGPSSGNDLTAIPIYLKK